MMKVLQLGKFYPIRGGVEKVMWDFTRGLSERGVDCDMLCAKLPSGNVEEDHRRLASMEGKILIIKLNDHGRVICVPALKKAAATMISPAMVSWLRKHCDDYDIIHVHHPDPMACLALALSGYKGRVFVHWHSDILKQKFFLVFYRPLQSWLIRRAEKIIGTTPVYVRESPCLRQVREKVTFVPIGVEPITCGMDEIGAVKDKFKGKKIVFSLGRLVDYKGFSFLIGASKTLGNGYQIVIGGEGPLKDVLNRLIISENAENNVYLPGRLSESEVRAFFRACDVFVLSSIWKTEAFGIVQIEAMSCGKPVVATRIEGSGVSWVNENGDSGLNVEVKNSEALAEAVKKITKDERTYSGFSERAKARYEKFFTFNVMIDNVLNIYNKK